MRLRIVFDAGDVGQVVRIFHPRDHGHARSIIKRLPGIPRGFKMLSYTLDGTNFEDVSHYKMKISTIPVVKKTVKKTEGNFNPVWIKAMLPHWSVAFMGGQL